MIPTVEGEQEDVITEIMVQGAAVEEDAVAEEEAERIAGIPPETQRKKLLLAAAVEVDQIVHYHQATRNQLPITILLLKVAQSVLVTSTPTTSLDFQDKYLATIPSSLTTTVGPRIIIFMDYRLRQQKVMFNQHYHFQHLLVI